ncbi:MAG: M42 family metallopeptidase [Chloroflexi bacterium]|jgi:putative aminopeptidase FrvX|nr:M42 family metallopeptidase [Chloroflexota bacterium]
MDTLLAQLVELAGGPGFEHRVAAFMAAEMEQRGAVVSRDAIGNVIGALDADQDAPAVMISAHMDEVSLLVKYIDPQGFIYFVPNGTVSEAILPGTQVDIWTMDGQAIPGVIGSRSRHLQDEFSSATPPRPWIDVGARDAADVTRLGVRVGDMVVFRPNFRRLANGHVVSKALDDRMGCALLLHILGALADQARDYRLYFVAATQEEVGSRGAGVAARHLHPSLALVIDTVPAADPSTAPQQTDVRLGGGPVLRTMDILPNMMGTLYARQVRNRLIETAEAAGIPYQLDIFPTWTDAATIHTTDQGVPTGGVFVPRRYSHSPAEVMDLQDMQHTADLIVAFLTQLDAHQIRQLTNA